MVVGGKFNAKEAKENPLRHRHTLVAPSAGGYYCDTCPYSHNYYGEPMPHPYYPGEVDITTARVVAADV